MISFQCAGSFHTIYPFACGSVASGACRVLAVCLGGWQRVCLTAVMQGQALV